MNSTATNIKESLRNVLEKEGSSLQDFELALETIITKKADVSAIPAMLATKVAPQTLMIAALAAGALGAGGGLAGYAGYKQLQNSDNRKNDMLKQKQQYEDAIARLQHLSSPQTATM